jgi:hypothetical protein
VSKGLIALCPLLLAGLLGLAGQASASRGYEFSKTFSKQCTAEPCGEALKKPTGVAVNEASGDVYVVDTGSNRVARFSASGAYLGQFDGTATFEVEGKLESGPVAGSLGRPGEIETGAIKEAESIAVDNSCALRGLGEPKCKEEDPSNGDVYIADSANRVIDKFAPDGEYLGQITEAEAGVSFQGEPLNAVATDGEGTVWVYRGGAEQVIDAFADGKGHAGGVPNDFLEEVAIAGLGNFALRALAVDGEGSFYVRHTLGVDAVGRISKFDRGGGLLSEEVDGEKSSGVAVELRSENALVDNLTSIGVFSAEGREVERVGLGQLAEGAGIGVNAGAGAPAGANSLYVADPGAGDVAVFGPVPATTPSVEGESASDVASSSAELGGELNPRSDPGEAASEYHFQYGRCASASASTCASSAYEAIAPVPDGQLAGDFETHPVSVHVQGLLPGATYHFRLLARNSHGEALPGAEASFTTQSAGGQLVLPDNRGWELVSPPDKQGARIEPITESGIVQAAGSGGAITYLANAPTEAGPQGYSNRVQVLSRRAGAAWSSRDIAIAHASATGFAVGPGTEYKFFDRELQLSAVQPFGEFVPQLSAEASESTAYLHELGGGCGEACFQPLVSGKAGFANVEEGVRFGEEELCTPSASSGSTLVACGPEFLGASEDLAHVVLRANAQLKAGAGTGQLYEWSAGQLRQASVLPDGKPAPESPAAQLGREDRTVRGAISSDGSRVIWSTAAPNSLYLREMALAKTVQLDKAQAGCSVECESGGGEFQLASPDGSRVLFTDTHKLTEDAGAGGTKADLYECKILISGSEPTCELSDLTPKRAGESADVQGGVLGASDDGSVIYLAANGVLDATANARGEQAQPGNCKGVSANGACNLYMREAGATSFVTRLAGGDNHDWSNELSNEPTRVSPDGRFLELMSERSLTGYDNRDVASGKAAAEVYLYDASTRRLSCASCDPTGARPAGVEYAKLRPTAGGLVGTNGWPESALVAANVPPWTAIGDAGTRADHQPRYLSDSGRLFFNSANALVPQDSNGTQDVYEYEPPGVGGCTSESPEFSESSGGCVALISSGASALPSAFMDASEAGDDVFFISSAKLSPLDADSARDIYDAHICSAASPCISSSSVQSPPCNTEASCKASPTPQPSIFGAPASATFSGPGNLAPAPPPAPRPKTAAQIRAERLAKALKACRAKKNRRKRAACEKQARKKYGARAAKKSKPKAKAKRKGGK